MHTVCLHDMAKCLEMHTFKLSYVFFITHAMICNLAIVAGCGLFHSFLGGATHNVHGRARSFLEIGQLKYVFLSSFFFLD